MIKVDFERVCAFLHGFCSGVLMLHRAKLVGRLMQLLSVFDNVLVAIDLYIANIMLMQISRLERNEDIQFMIFG